MIAVADIKALDAQLNAQIEEANTAVTACSAFAPGDATAWAGFYAAWGAIHTQWTSTNATLLGGFNFGGVFVVEYFAEDLYNKMLTYQRLFPAWQSKIHAACPSYVIPPGVLVQPAPSDRTGELIDKAIKAAEVTGGILVTGVIAYAIFQTVVAVRAIKKAV